jgi:hypothetical protein
MPSSRQRETAPRLVSSRPSLYARSSNSAHESDARPSIPAPCVNVARRSRDGAPGGLPSQGPTGTNSGRRNVRRHACRSARRGLESAWVRPRIVVEVASPPPVPCLLFGVVRQLERGTGESAETPRIAEPRTFSRRAEAKRSRPNSEASSRAKSRREALGTATGASEVERRSAQSTGRKRPVSRRSEPPKRARRRENAVRTGLSIASSMGCRKTSRRSS